MKKLILLAAAATGFVATSASAQRLQPDCERIDRDTIVLKYHGAQIDSRRDRARIPLKMHIRNNCNLRNLDRLNRISTVTVAGRSFTRETAVWLETANGNSRVKYLVSGRRGEGNNRVEFYPGRRGRYTDGRMQVLFNGDLNLRRIRIQFQPRHGGGGGGQPPRPPRDVNVYNIECKSKDFESEFCSVPGLTRAYVVQQLSSTSCRENRNFFILRDGIRVTEGCRAIFRVEAQTRRGRF